MHCLSSSPVKQTFVRAEAWICTLLCDWFPAIWGEEGSVHGCVFLEDYRQPSSRTGKLSPQPEIVFPSLYPGPHLQCLNNEPYMHRKIKLFWKPFLECFGISTSGLSCILFCRFSEFFADWEVGHINKCQDFTVNNLLTLLF